MKHKLFSISLLIIISCPSFGQSFPAEEIKKNKIKSITINNAIGEKQLQFDTSGQLIRELHEGNFFMEREVFYSSKGKPDSIINEAKLSFLSYRQYFIYSPDKSSISITVYKDRTDTLYSGKDSKEIKQQSSDGSKIKYEYNTKHQLVKKTTTAKEGNAETEESVYDVQGNVIKRIFLSGKGNSIITNHTYNAQRKLLTSISTGAGRFSTATGNSKFQYDAKGLLVKEISMRGTFNNTATYSYEFYSPG